MIKIVDSVMGSGKTSYAIKYMQDNPDLNFLVVTPFLSEIERITQEVPRLKTPNIKNGKGKKFNHLKSLTKKGESIITTHAMLEKFDKETIEHIRLGEYILILDEVANVITPWDFPTSSDKKNFLQHYGGIDSEGYLYWDNEKNPIETYKEGSAFYDVMLMCENRTLVSLSDKLMLWQLPIEVFKHFTDVFVLTYMFQGSYQKSYFDLFNVKYEYLSVKDNQLIPYQATSIKQRQELKELIHIVHNEKMNFIGSEKYSLSKSWYIKNIETNPRIKNIYRDRLKSNLTNFFTHIGGNKASNNLYSTFKDYQNILKGKGYAKGFIPFNSRATNEYREKSNIAYLVNVYPHGDIISYMVSNNIKIDLDHYALSTLLQTLFRTRIRNFKDSKQNREINLYLPSSRMRTLLEKWLNNEIE